MLKKELVMTLLWEKEFITGVIDIDEQHKKLSTFVDRLEKITNQAKPDIREARRTIILLGTYARAHLSYEEDWGIRYNCQFDEQYKEVNTKFTIFYQTLKRTSDENGIDKDLLERLYIPTKSWLIHHIDSTKHIIREAAGARASKIQALVEPVPQSKFLS